MNHPQADHLVISPVSPFTNSICCFACQAHCFKQKNPPPFVTARASAKPAEQSVGGSKLGRGGETSATSVVSLTWESRGREEGFLHSFSQLCRESSVPAPSPLPAQGTGKKSSRTNASCILQLDFEHLHGSGDNHLAGTRTTACQHLLQQCQLFPAQRKERESIRGGGQQ